MAVLFVGVFTVSSLVTGFVVTGLSTGAAIPSVDSPLDHESASDDATTAREGAVIDDPERVVTGDNEHIDQLPAVLRDRIDDDRKQQLPVEASASLRNNLADEVIEFRVQTEDGDVETYTAWTDGEAYIVDYRTGESEAEPGVTVSTDEATIDAVAAADDRPKAVDDAVEAGDIDVQGTSVDGFMLDRSLELYADLL